MIKTGLIKTSRCFLDSVTLNMKYFLLLASLALVAHSKTIVVYDEDILDVVDFESSPSEKPTTVNICNGCNTFNAENMTMVQILNLYKKKPENLIEAEPIFETTVAGDPQGLSQTVNVCNGCQTFNAKNMTLFQVINMEYDPKEMELIDGFNAELFAQSIPTPFGQTSQGKLSKGTPEINLELCNGCSIFNAYQMTQIQVINCKDQ